MGGCTNCSSKAGCDDRKHQMFAVIDRVLDDVYPTRCWGQLDDVARFGAGVGAEDGRALAEELGQALSASTFFRQGDESDPCDYIYVLCMGREPSLLQVRDGQVPLPRELAGGVATELHLRMCLSGIGRLVGTQQVALSLEACGEAISIVERPRAGVFDAPLLSRLQRAVALLPAYDLMHVDFGDVSAPRDDLDDGEYPQRYGQRPALANFLFYPHPLTAETTTLMTPATPALDRDTLSSLSVG